jgi:putative heme iron utilization protein
MHYTIVFLNLFIISFATVIENINQASFGLVEEAAYKARLLVKESSIGVLATTQGQTNDQPFASMDYYVGDCKSYGGSPIFFLSDLQVNIRNMKKNPKVAFAIRNITAINEISTPMKIGRVTLMGTLSLLKLDNYGELVDCFVRSHSDAKLWINFPDFKFYQLSVDRIYWIGGFGGPNFIGYIPKDMYDKVNL